ncbi:A/G-specific adenine glycosylase [Ulvibacter litoralis]|uniref:Adenine DNA glycosylase n=1 Tax=Ulvibacter litoralis TaxID=227084 RepID=A0A1G7CWF4_9FLAO|nr:A/G-specific adenine glycosylase [Ulvibacter litoralis]GHC45993.1 A/G-specific adenine glycosylase [Ulvibacter litoralis]SDE42976.1 A/G-specific adenine glycosylase [Ulvibacter litoralis]
MLLKPTFFRKNLISWYLVHKRELPWRSTRDPYAIWLSEIILQQTRVAQGLPYYERFLRAFPTVEDLAAASEEKILKLWQGLGYYSRARNLHFTAKYIVDELHGVFPTTYKELLTLKGVGDYTASAIASICYNEPAAVVDGNVYRVLSRVFGISTPVNTTEGIKQFKALAQELVDEKDPGTFNQASMEFGARYCVPQNPDCKSCIFNSICDAYASELVGTLPVKLKKTTVRKRYFNYIVVLSEAHKTILQQRSGKGIWQQLYEFPLIETKKDLTYAELIVMNEFKELSEELCVEDISLYNDTLIIHKLSHQHLYTRFWIAESNGFDVKASFPEKTEVAIAEIEEYAVPVLIENFISEFSVFKL